MNQFIFGNNFLCTFFIGFLFCFLSTVLFSTKTFNVFCFQCDKFFQFYTSDILIIYIEILLFSLIFAHFYLFSPTYTHFHTLSEIIRPTKTFFCPNVNLKNCIDSTSSTGGASQISGLRRVPTNLNLQNYQMPILLIILAIAMT